MEIPESVRDFPLVVKPRQNGYKHYDLIAISNETALTEDGERVTTDTVLRSLHRYKMPVCIVKQNVADFVEQADGIYGEHPSWQWRASSKREEIWTPNVNIKTDIEKVVIHYFGWKTSVFHMALDPVVFYGRSINEIWPGDEPREVKLLLWSTALREFCCENNIALRPTNGAVAAQFLRDSRFYPNNRRKIPKATNDRVRDNLPGNHYRLYVNQSHRERSAFYLDQSRAHHYHAEHTPLPDGDSLFAFGRFRTLGDPVYSNVFDNFTGLYLADIYTRQIPCNDPFGTFNARDHQFTAFVYSNEVEFIQSRGYEIKGIRAAWGSKHLDTGIKRYSIWAQQQLNIYQEALWLKPILLCTYGILAATPTDMSFVYKRTEKPGKPVTLLAGHKRLHGYLLSHTNGRKIESKVVNVLHRGMIESATRLETLKCASFLHSAGFQLLQLYADAVIVEDDGTYRADEIELPYPWRLHKHLHHYRPVSSQAFVSGEMVRLPGVTGQERIRFSLGGNKNVPIKPYFEAGTGRRIGYREQSERGMKVRHV